MGNKLLVNRSTTYCCTLLNCMFFWTKNECEAWLRCEHTQDTSIPSNSKQNENKSDACLWRQEKERKTHGQQISTLTTECTVKHFRCCRLERKVFHFQNKCNLHEAHRIEVKIPNSVCWMETTSKAPMHKFLNENCKVNESGSGREWATTTRKTIKRVKENRPETSLKYF